MYDANGDGLIHRSEIRHVILAAYRLGGHYHPGRSALYYCCCPSV